MKMYAFTDPQKQSQFKANQSQLKPIKCQNKPNQSQNKPNFKPSVLVLKGCNFLLFFVHFYSKTGVFLLKSGAFLRRKKFVSIRINLSPEQAGICG